MWGDIPSDDSAAERARRYAENGQAWTDFVEAALQHRHDFEEVAAQLNEYKRAQASMIARSGELEKRKARLEEFLTVPEKLKKGQNAQARRHVEELGVEIKELEEALQAARLAKEVYEATHQDVIVRCAEDAVKMDRWSAYLNMQSDHLGI